MRATVLVQDVRRVAILASLGMLLATQSLVASLVGRFWVPAALVL